ncbi:MAG: thioredoxin family protein [Akkermansiaceae bacterium]|nr:thioredoxin family protein [Akkermansiaceae bacterium]
MKFLITLLFSAALASYTHAQFDPFAGDPAEKKTEASLTSEVSATAPGETFTVAIRLKHAAGWHAYYKNPGGPGLSLSFDWDLPAGYELKALHWPTPHLYESEGTQFYVYENEYFLLADITTPVDAKTGDKVAISVTPTWQLCNDVGCDQPQSKELSITLPVGQEASLDARQKELFAKARQSMPLTQSPWAIKVFKQGGKFIIDLTPDAADAPELKDAVFISSDNQTNGIKPQQFEKTDTGYQISVPAAKETGNGDKVESFDHLSGILHSNTGWIKGDPGKGLEFHQLPIEKKPLESASAGALLGIIGGMLIGGLILNLMPCVFPVIGLKIMGFAQQAGEDKKKVVLHGITFAAGVLVSFWVLAGFLLSLRNKALEGAGEDVGWGYQLQNPYTVLTILMLMFVLALNMFGVFEIGTSATGIGGKLQSKQGLQGSFFSGVLATVVATPCSAPFLGAAIGAAFVLPNIQFMLAFTAMALGLALPYLILSIFPNLIDKLPRPGPWMESFKQGMSFLLFATAGYLLWIYVAQTGLDFMFNIILGLSLVAIALWIYGRWNMPHRSQKVRGIAKVIAVLTLAGGLFITLPPDKSNQLHWEKWSAAKVEELQESGTPVFVDFTATWCATCQVNKKNAYPPEIVELFKEYGIVALKGDKTNPSPDIEKKLQELGRTAIPVNVLYVPGKDEPIITPELLTADYIRELITSNLEKPVKEE